MNLIIPERHVIWNGESVYLLEKKKFQLIFGFKKPKPKPKPNSLRSTEYER
jgi:hypothetical protein